MLAFESGARLRVLGSGSGRKPAGSELGQRLGGRGADAIWVVRVEGSIRDMSDDQLLSLQQIADSMSLSLATVRVWVHDKRLPAEKLRHRWMVRRGDLERFLADNPNLGHPKSAAGKAAVAAVDAVPEDWSEQPEEAMTDLARMRLAPWGTAVTRALLPPSQAVDRVREGDVSWKAALGGLASYPARLRTLAEAAEEQSRALTLAHLANVQWKPR